ncbi:MAG: tryptophan--tRNA ligase [Planctomycetes bacterium]|nr:tryptophan--tRNA ligase [Planctomycetota bacterium]
MPDPAPQRKRILSGIQPSGRLHLGNYFGAIKRHIEMQDAGECFYFVADYHALTTVRDPAALHEFSLDVATTYLAVGLDPARTVLYRQSDVPEVCELTWLLETVTSMGLLEKAHSYKEKVARGITPSVGLFTYPALMAADILGPQADAVPVGGDQDQHVELTRDMAQAFHAAFPTDEPVFRIPESLIGEAARVPGTTFEKGAVLHVVTDVRAPGLEPDDYAARFRALVADLQAAATDPGALQTTEDWEAAIASAHATAIAGVEVVGRTLRTVAEDPGRRVLVTPRPGGIAGLEFYVPVDRVVFVTKAGKRQAAKMSKSYGNTIEIFAAGKPLKKRVMGIETRLVDLADPLDADEDLVIQLYALFATGAELAEMRAHYAAGGFGFGRAKQALLDRIDAHFAPFRERRAELEREPDRVLDVLRDGARRARPVIADTVDRARAACGLGRRA